jgi:hypothetical protein
MRRKPSRRQTQEVAAEAWLVAVELARVGSKTAFF